MSDTQKKKNVIRVLLSRKFLTLFLAYVAGCFAFSCMGSVFVKYGTNSLGIDAVSVGAVAGMVSMIGLFMRPVSAVIVDQFNRKFMLILSYGLVALASVVLILTKSLGGLYAAQIIRGIGWNLISSAGYIMVGESVDKDDLGTAISVYSMAMIIASSFSAVLILGIANAFSYQMCFVATAAFALLSVLLICTMPSTGKKIRLHEDQSLAENLKSIRLSNIISPKCLPIVVISFGFQFISVMLSASWIVKFADAELGIINAGIFATVANVIMYFTKPAFGKVMDSFGCRWCVYASGVGYAAACIIAGTASNMTVLLVAAAVYGLFCGGNAMAARTMAMKMMPFDRQAVGTSTVGLGNDFGMTLANIAIPVWAGILGTYGKVYYVMAAIAAAVLVYSIIYGRIYLKRNPGNEMHW